MDFLAPFLKAFLPVVLWEALQLSRKPCCRLCSFCLASLRAGFPAGRGVRLLAIFLEVVLSVALREAFAAIPQAMLSAGLASCGRSLLPACLSAFLQAVAPLFLQVVLRAALAAAACPPRRHRASGMRGISPDVLSIVSRISRGRLAGLRVGFGEPLASRKTSALRRGNASPMF